MSGRVSLVASESLHVSGGTGSSLSFETGSLGLAADGDVSVSSSAGVSVGGKTVSVAGEEDVSVSSGSGLRLLSGSRWMCLQARLCGWVWVAIWMWLLAAVRVVELF